MAKRIADDQITREGYDDILSDEGVSEAPKVVTASAEVMSTRKIAMPKRKMAFAKKTSASTSETAFGNAFSLKKKSNDDKIAKLKALNLQFNKKITEFITNDPFVNLTSLFTKYETYIKDINKVEIPKETKPAPSTSEKPVEKTIEGPSFTIASQPIKSDSVFSFGKKKETKPKDDSDSESDIEIKGPEFTFNGTVKSDIFKFSEKPSVEEQKKNETKPTFTFANSTITATDDINTDKKEEPAKTIPSFNFGNTAAQDQTNEPKSGNEKPSFSFGATSSSEQKKPSFAFGTTSLPNETNTPSIFGNSTSQTTENKAPSFSFGTKPTEIKGKDDETPKPSFTFGVPKSVTDNEKKDDDKPAFTFGTTTQSTSDKPKFSFGTTPTTNSETSENDQEKKPKFDFSFNAHKEQLADKKQEDKKEASKPSFTFSTATNSATPSFSFGNQTTSNPFTTATDSTKEKSTTPSGGFKFSLPFEQKSATPESNATSATPVSIGTDEVAEEATNKPATTDSDKKEGTPVSLQNGEEDEDAIFSQRAKLMVFNTESKTYDSRGVGEMKVLQKNDDKSKVRLLCRSDGMGNVLLNTNIIKSFNYVPLTSDNDNLVKTPVIDSEGKLTTYIVKFKLKADGRAFMKAIEDCKREIE